MLFVRQDGEKDDCVEVQLSGSKITYTPRSDRRKKPIAGIYKDRKRATEVYLEMMTFGWNGNKGEFVMPKD